MLCARCGISGGKLQCNFKIPICDACLYAWGRSNASKIWKVLDRVGSSELVDKLDKMWVRGDVD
jgi:hypothetical protein